MKIRNMIISAVLAAGLLLTTGCGNKDGQTPDLTKGITVVEGESSKGNVGELTLAAGDLVAVFDIEGYGEIKAKLFPDIAPVGVDNFKQLCDSGYFEGLTIHRVIPDFMLQGGSLNGDGTGGDAMVEGGSFGIETDLENARHFYGALCYANAMGNNSTQFYIVNNKTSQQLADFSIDMINSYAQQYAGAADEYRDNPDAYAYYKFYEGYYKATAEAVSSANTDVRNKYFSVGGTPSLDGNYTVFGQVYDGLDVVDKISACDTSDNGNGENSLPVKKIVINSVKVYTYTAE